MIFQFEVSKSEACGCMLVVEQKFYRKNLLSFVKILEGSKGCLETLGTKVH